MLITKQFYLWDIFFLSLFDSDRFRTTINVFGDSIGCAIVQHLSRKELAALDEKNEAEKNNKPDAVLPALVTNTTTTEQTTSLMLV